MKHLKIYEEKTNNYIGIFLKDKFFPNSKEPHKINESREEDEYDSYLVNMYFFALDSEYFDGLIKLRDYLHSKYDVDYDMIGIYHRGLCEDEYDNRLEIEIRGEYIDKLEEEAKFYLDAKNYNL